MDCIAFYFWYTGHSIYFHSCRGLLLHSFHFAIVNDDLVKFDRQHTVIYLRYILYCFLQEFHKVSGILSFLMSLKRVLECSRNFTAIFYKKKDTIKLSKFWATLQSIIKTKAYLISLRSISVIQPHVSDIGYILGFSVRFHNV